MGEPRVSVPAIFIATQNLFPPGEYFSVALEVLVNRNAWSNRNLDAATTVEPFNWLLHLKAINLLLVRFVQSSC